MREGCSPASLVHCFVFKAGVELRPVFLLLVSLPDVIRWGSVRIRTWKPALTKAGALRCTIRSVQDRKDIKRGFYGFCFKALRASWKVLVKYKQQKVEHNEKKNNKNLF